MKIINSFYAHSGNEVGKWHGLKEHLIAVAEYAQSFSPTEKLRPLFFLAGILHDVGKFQIGFQKYLECGKPKTPHAGIGAFFAQTLAKQHIALQFAIQGHHA